MKRSSAEHHSSAADEQALALHASRATTSGVDATGGCPALHLGLILVVIVVATGATLFTLPIAAPGKVPHASPSSSRSKPLGSLGSASYAACASAWVS